MDDLSGLSWTPDTRKTPLGSTPTTTTSGSNYSNFNIRATPPVSGRSTPYSTQPTQASAFKPPSNPPSKTATPANDSFSNLVSFGSSNAALNKNLSLLEQQKLLAAQRNQNAQSTAQYGAADSKFWDSLEGKTNVALPSRSNVASPDEDDLLAAFNSAAPVDASSHFPPPASSRTSTPLAATTSNATSKQNTGGNMMFDDDDDPFGLGQMQARPRPGAPAQAVPQTSAAADDDDVLGLLGRPVSEFAKPRREPSPPPPAEMPQSDNPQDRCIAELVDMGFPAAKARQALQATGDGTDVQAAVGWLLQQAHTESREKAKGRAGTPAAANDRSGSSRGRAGESSRDRDSSSPAWMNERRPESQRRSEAKPSNAEKDPSQYAAEIGTSFFKTANSLWKAGSKKMQQAVQEFNADGADSGQPRWMREAQLREQQSRRSNGNGEARAANVTDEAMMLEAGSGRPSRTASKAPAPAAAQAPSRDRRETASPATSSRTASPQLNNFKAQQQLPTDPRARLNRQLVEEQSAQAYVSPARRKKTTPQPAAAPTPPPAAEPDLLSMAASGAPISRPTPSPQPQSQSQSQQRPKTSTPIAVRPKAPTRNIPPVSSASLSSSNNHRTKGTEAFKRGDYSAAHQCYTSALSPLPQSHPITIIILTNRALTALKIGEPKTAIADADNAIAVIGFSKGEAEQIDLGNGDAPKEMREFFGKALMRKAEALEHLERWGDAAGVWREAVESGHGGATSIQGRSRCEKAAGISKPAAAPSRKMTPAPRKSTPVAPRRPPPSASSALSSADAEAVTRLRAANAAADKADDEKFALSDSVEARVNAWKNGKADNLRALLGSLENVLWEGSGWKKVGLAELVLPNRVKIAYMKGIGKCHPDKVCLNLFWF